SLFKIGVFLAEGVPALASPVPSYREVLIPERTGLLCDSLRDWEEALDRVREDRELLRRWSAEAHEAMRPYLTEAVARRYAELFRELAS
ncbi:MAG: glycosyltransferase, partial [Candidatus Rokubacteria bacterium]|nr:glycosyltransferase [Candidatus Rokubacteria bacterium]